MGRIALACPQCGAEMEFLEEQHVVRCSFCSSRLLVLGRHGVLRYSLRPAITDPRRALTLAQSHWARRGLPDPRPAEVFPVQVPFWRFQGILLAWIFGSRMVRSSEPDDLFPNTSERVRELVARPLDHTRPAFESVSMELNSLGLRPQVLPLTPLDPGPPKSFSIPVEVGMERALENLESLGRWHLEVHGVTAERVIGNVVGARLSLVFSPAWYTEHLCGEAHRCLLLDGLEGNVLAEGDSPETLLGPLGQRERSSGVFGQLKLIPFRCPNCGWDLPFRPYNVAHLCQSCGRLWTEHQGKLKEVSFRLGVPPQAGRWKDYLWVPFWVFPGALRSGDSVVRTVQDLRRLAPAPPGAPRPARGDAPLRLYVPAMRLADPKASNSLAVRLTASQPDPPSVVFPQGESLRCAGASLSEQDARQMALAVLAGVVPFRNRRVLEWLFEARAELGTAQVLFLPFTRQDIFWRDPVTKAFFPHSPNCPDLQKEP